MRNDGGPAFPRPASEDKRAGSIHEGDYAERAETGMSLRDWFAGQAMAAFLTGDVEGNDTFKTTARISYEQADAMIAEREKSE